MGEEILDRDDFIDRFRAGDPEALVALWEYCNKRLIAIIRYLQLQFQLPDLYAEDLVKEVYLDWFERKFRTYDKSKGPFKWWARVVVKRSTLSRNIGFLED